VNIQLPTTPEYDEAHGPKRLAILSVDKKSNKLTYIKFISLFLDKICQDIICQK
jgi:hypothetical protein